jgi:hypothetical protein
MYVWSLKILGFGVPRAVEKEHKRKTDDGVLVLTLLGQVTQGLVGWANTGICLGLL